MILFLTLNGNETLFPNEKKGGPHEIVDSSVAVDAEGEVNWDERIFEVAVHDEVSVRQPDVFVVVDGVEKLVATRVRVAQPRVKPLLLQQELNFVFLKQVDKYTRMQTSPKVAKKKNNILLKVAEEND